MARVFITSATGYIGEAVANEFKQKGDEIVSLARSDESAARLEKRGIKVLRGDIKQPKSFLSAVKDADIVIHTASTGDGDFAKVDQLATEEILSALEKSDKTFVYTSGIWLLGNTGAEPADESAPLKPIKMVEFRAELEKKVLTFQNRGVKTIIMRPAVVYDASENGVIGGFVKAAKEDGFAKYIGSGQNRLSVIHRDDVAQAYHIAVSKSAGGTIYHISTDEQITYRELAELAAEAAGVAGNVQSWAVEEASKAFGPFIDGFLLDQHIISTNTKKLGWQPKVQSIREGMKLPANTCC
jgi:nucleoside-diphosphate-sugar epimerase